MQPISICDQEIPCEMQLEIEHLTLDEAIASGLFDLPDEPGTAPAIENIPYPPVDEWARQATPGPGTNGVSRPSRLSFPAGESDGGSGVWVLESSRYPYSDPKAATYQQLATGAPAGTEYLLTGVPTRFMKLGKKYFDGYDPQTNTLIDAKIYAGWPGEELGWSSELRRRKNRLWPPQ